MGDTVRYTEYEDGTEEPSLRWSNGRMKQSIPKAVIWIWMKSYPDSGCSGQVGATGPFGFVNMKNLAVAAVILAVLGVLSYTYIQSNKKTIHKYLEGIINFSYQTSITSDLNEKERADVLH